MGGKILGPLVLAGILYVSVAFGQRLIGGHKTVADIGIHLGLVVAALLLAGDGKRISR